MAQVSTRRMHPEVEKRVYEVFWHSFTSIANTETAAAYLKELLSSTEQTMLAKRLAIGILIKKGYTYDQILHTLKVSKGTVLKIARLMEENGENFHAIAEKNLRAFKMDQFTRELDKSLDKYRRLRRHPKTLHREQPF